MAASHGLPFIYAPIPQGFSQLNQGRPSEKSPQQTPKGVGERRGEKPLGNTMVRETLNTLRDRGNMDRVCAVAPLPNEGNSLSRCNPRIEEALQLAVHAAVRDPRGSWITVLGPITHDWIDLSHPVPPPQFSS